MASYDFDTPNVELAEAVLKVADDYNVSKSKYSSCLHIDIDIDFSPFFRSAIKQQYPDIDDTELNQIIEQFMQEQEREKAEKKLRKNG